MYIDERLEKIMQQQHSELTCEFCGGTFKPEEFYPSGSLNALSRVDKKGIMRMPICMKCAKSLFKYLCKLYKTYPKGLYNFCAAMDIYYDDKIAQKIEKQDVEDFLQTYFSLISKSLKYSPQSFVLSPKVKTDIGEVEDISEPKELDDTDMLNRREILTFYHFDPFETDNIPDKKCLYRDLVTLIDDSMANDLPKRRAAITLARNYLKLDKITEAIQSLSATPADMVRNNKDIKVLTELSQKANNEISTITKDYGFSARYALNNSRGAGTLGSIVRDIENLHYDEGKINLYDIKTGKSMQKIAEISTNAIMKQLNLSEADYIDMIKEQRSKLVELNKELLRTKEENRLIYKQITKQELLKELYKELQQKGIQDKEIEDMILAEIDTAPEYFPKKRGGGKSS